MIYNITKSSFLERLAPQRVCERCLIDLEHVSAITHLIRTVPLTTQPHKCTTSAHSEGSKSISGSDHHSFPPSRVVEDTSAAN